MRVKLALTLLAASTVLAGSAASLPTCSTEDSTGCYWNASTQGNGQGRSFIASPVEAIDPCLLDPECNPW